MFIYLLQLLEYARYNIPSQVIRDERSTARAICSDEIKEAYYDTHEVKAFFTLILLSPTLWTIWVLLIYFGNIENVGTTLEDKKNYPYLVALACTSIVVMIYIIIMDFAAALYFACGWHEYELHGVLDTFNHAITWLSFLSNCAVCITTLGLFCCEHYTKEADDHSKFMFIICGATICFSSHLGYIVIAWLTEPGKTASIFLTALCVLFFLVAVFRSAYTITKLKWYKDIKNEITDSQWYKDKITDSKWYKYIKTKITDSKWYKNNIKIKKTGPYCNCVFIAAVGFIFGVLPSMLILGVFNVIPVPAYELASYFENIIRIILVLAAGIFTYRVLSFEDSDVKKFLKQFTISWTGKKADDDIFETTGKHLGEFAQCYKSFFCDGLIVNTQCGPSMLLEVIIIYLNKKINSGSDLSGCQRHTLSSLWEKEMHIIYICKLLQGLYQTNNKTYDVLNLIHDYEQCLLNYLREMSEEDGTQWSILKNMIIIYITQYGQKKIDDKQDADSSPSSNT